MGKGSARRPTDDKRFREGWERTFGKTNKFAGLREKMSATAQQRAHERVAELLDALRDGRVRHTPVKYMGWVD